MVTRSAIAPETIVAAVPWNLSVLQAMPRDSWNRVVILPKGSFESGKSLDYLEHFK